MMALGFGNLPQAVGEIERLAKVGKPVLTLQVMFVNDLPATAELSGDPPQIIAL